MADTRDPDSLRRHFEVERELADKLRRSTRSERSKLFGDLYSELFRRVPDHPRLQRRESDADSRKSVAAQMRLLEPFLGSAKVFLEFAPGDCRLAAAVAGRVSKVVAVDISDQRSTSESSPANLELIVYDGYDLDLPPGSVDLAFSYQFLEHLHPDDAVPHLKQAADALAPGGVYVLSTPHRLSGPHDISRHFSDDPLGFHLKEWSYHELLEAAKEAGFSGMGIFRSGKVWWNPLVTGATMAGEHLIGVLPRKWQRKLAARAYSAVNAALVK